MTEYDFEKTFVVDYDEVNGELNAVHVPEGYNFTWVWKGYGSNSYAYIRGRDDQTYDEEFVAAAYDLAENADVGGWKSKADNLWDWKESNPDVDIDLEKDIVFVFDEKYSVVHIYAPPNIKIIRTKLYLADDGELRVAAAKFLDEQHKQFVAEQQKGQKI